MNYIRKKINIELAAPTIIMAFGIFFIDAIEYIPALTVLESSFIALFVIIACFIFAMIGLTYVNKRSLQELLDQPVRIFALGT